MWAGFKSNVRTRARVIVRVGVLDKHEETGLAAWTRGEQQLQRFLGGDNGVVNMTRRSGNRPQGCTRPSQINTGWPENRLLSAIVDDGLFILGPSVTEDDINTLTEWHACQGEVACVVMQTKLCPDTFLCGDNFTIGKFIGGWVINHGKLVRTGKFNVHEAVGCACVEECRTSKGLSSVYQVTSYFAATWRPRARHVGTKRRLRVRSTSSEKRSLVHFNKAR
jgi:hypothetical protein